MKLFFCRCLAGKPLVDTTQAPRFVFLDDSVGPPAQLGKVIEQEEIKTALKHQVDSHILMGDLAVQ